MRFNVSRTFYASSFDFQYAVSVCDASMGRLIQGLADDKHADAAFVLARMICAEVGANNDGYGLASKRSENLDILLTKPDDGFVAEEPSESQFGRSRKKPISPCRLKTQELVDLLKMPTCVGTARRVIIDHLSNRYGRRFDNHWAFVRFAREQNLGLDFTTPPKRPDPRESVKRMLEILDPSGEGSDQE